MSRVLPLAVVQAEPLPIDDPVPALAAQVGTVLSDHPAVELVVFPELHLFGVDGRRDGDAAERAAAQPLDGPLVTSLAEIARDHGVWLVPGTVCERGRHDELYNTAVVLSPRGELAASYRKCFPWRPFEPYEPGDRFVVVDLPGIGRVGLSICYDAWFPEVARHLAWMGAELILTPTRTTTCDRDQEVVLTRASAIANQVWVVSVNAAAPYARGRSLIVDPEGRVRVEAGETATVLTDVPDLDDVRRVRHFGTAGTNRVWSQFTTDDSPLELPLYHGRIDARQWHPAVPD